MERISWTDYFMEMAFLVSKRSTCLRRKVGAVITKDNQIISTGYNGVPSGIIHCDAVGCVRADANIPSGERSELCRGIHAEQNAIIQAARHGSCPIEGATLYCTTFPCIICAKMIINVGIKQIVYASYYNDQLSFAMLSKSKVNLLYVPFEKEN